MTFGHEIVVVSRQVELEPKETPIQELGFAGDKIPFLRNFAFPARCLSFLKPFDIVHTQYHPDIFVGNMAKKMLKKTHVFTYHGFAPVRIWNSPRQKLKMIDHRIGTFCALRAGVDHIITVSHFLRKELIDNYLVDEEVVDVIYNGIDVETFSPNTNGEEVRQRYKLRDDPVILFLGRLVPYKGVQFLLNAAPLVLREFPNAKFLIGGAMRHDVLDVVAITRKLKIEDSVVFTGFVPDEFVPQLYACCDVFCYPSLWEGFGLTPGEAQASGKPVVAFKTCAIPEVVADGRTGLLVEPKNHTRIADAIISLLKDEKLRRKMGSEARQRVMRLFSWKKAARQTIKIYEEAIS